MLSNLSAGRKILAAFGAFSMVVTIGAIILISSVISVSNQGITVGQRLAPLTSAAIEIRLTAANAHLLIEEIMAGNASETIQDVTAYLDDTQFYAEAILNGGENESGTYFASGSPEVRAEMEKVINDLSVFRKAIANRYALLEGNQGVGSSADFEFDGLYDGIITQIDDIGTAYRENATVQRLIGQALFLLAHGHLLVEELLSGDTGEDFSEALSALSDAATAIDDIGKTVPAAAPSIASAVAAIERFAELASLRYEAFIG